MNVIIIDDEKKAREVLSYHLKISAPKINIVGSFSNIKKASIELENLDFDLIFLDINMPKGNGFEFLKTNDLQDKLIVFVTAHENYAIDAFKVNAFDYLLKPVDSEEIERIYKKAILFIKNQNHILQKKPMVYFKSGYTNVRLMIDNILHISSQGNYTTVFVKNEDTYMISKNLKKVEDLYFSDFPFIRIHQSHIINLNNIVKFDSSLLTLEGGTTIPISKLGVKILKQIITID